jgi:hypothetical protein
MKTDIDVYIANNTSSCVLKRLWRLALLRLLRVRVVTGINTVQEEIQSMSPCGQPFDRWQ